MKIFVTGATGFIGGAVARTAAGAGHEVLALAHHGEAEREFSRRGYAPAGGDLRELDGLRRWVREADAVVHAGFAAGREGVEIDEAATRAMVEALEERGVNDGAGTAFVYTSGVWVLGATGDETATEESPADPHPIVAWRGPLEEWLLSKAAGGVRTVIVRPGVVHGGGDGIPAKIARGELPFVGDGRQRWSIVHVDDLADLYLAAVERAPVGAVLHGVTEDAEAIEVVRAASPEGDLPEPVPVEEARRTIGAFADALALSQRVSSRRTQDLVGWRPTRTLG